MWPDNESEIDLLGFAVHKDLISQLITNDSLLPLTVGVFGDWGGGKSSILRMLQKELNQEKKYPQVACLYFSGWIFEGYDDAKAALISSVLLQLGEHKRFGPKVRDGVVKLLKRIDLMRILPLVLKHGVAPLAGAALTSGIAALGLDPQLAQGNWPLAASILTSTGISLANLQTPAGGQSTTTQSTPVQGAATSASAPVGSEGEALQVDWLELLKKDKTTPSVLDLRTFRHDFERTIAETELRVLVILIDDLDRCMPDRLIENLEAIRLFLAVPRTAFVIAADERIVRHAVSIRYAAPRLRDEQSAYQETQDLVTDYVEKLIQIPYHLPRLSPSEIETYMTLLFCQLHLEKKDFTKLLSNCEAARRRNLYVTYGAGAVKDVLGDGLTDELGRRLQWIGTVAPILAEGLKGNPRQVKRFLNALVLRKQLADVAGLQLRDDVLVKLMLLEYTRPVLFDQLYLWQAREDGCPKELEALEKRTKDSSLGQTLSVVEHLPDGCSPQWGEQPSERWLKLEPTLGGMDLRDYFWVARDKLKATAHGLTMVSPIVRRIFEGLMSANPGERSASAGQVQGLDQRELSELFSILRQQVQRETDGRRGVDGFLSLIEQNIDNAVLALIEALQTLSTGLVDPSFAYDLQKLVVEEKLADSRSRPVLERWAATQTRAGAVAKLVLQQLDGMKGAKS